MAHLKIIRNIYHLNPQILI